VDGPADAHAAAVRGHHQRHAPSRVAGPAVEGHVRHHVGTVVDVRGLTVRGVGPGDVVVVAPDDNGADLTPAHQVVEGQGDTHAALGVRVEDARLGSHHQPILAGVTHPGVVVAILRAAFRIDAAHGHGI